jgi:hypothetical protein
MTPVFRLTTFFALVTSMFAAGTLDALVNAAQGFSLAILLQIAESSDARIDRHCDG